jgi:hypothetical protein
LVPVAVWPPHAAVYPVIIAPPLAAGAVKPTVAEPFPAVVAPIVGAWGGVAYVKAAGFAREPLLLAVKVTGPTAAGVTVNVCAAAEPEKDRVIGALSPPPEGVIVIEPVYTELGVTVKRSETTPTAPPLGPVSVKLSAGATGVTWFEAADAGLVPAPFVAVTVQVYATPLVRPDTVSGLLVPVAVCPPQSTV